MDGTDQIRAQAFHIGRIEPKNNLLVEPNYKDDTPPSRGPL